MAWRIAGRFFSSTALTNSHDEFTGLSVCITPLCVEVRHHCQLLVYICVFVIKLLTVEHDVCSCSLRKISSTEIVPLSCRAPLVLLLRTNRSNPEVNMRS